MPKVKNPSLKKLLTFSALATYRSCPRKYKHRFEDHLKSPEKQGSLYFGHAIHSAITLWYKTSGDLRAVYRLIDSYFPKYLNDPDQKQDRMLAYVMLTGYADRYQDENWRIVGLDLEFSGSIRNPRTGCESRTFQMAGKVNGIVEIDGEYFLLEHRTASTTEDLTPETLWTDTQSLLYSYYLRQKGFPIVGVIYNILHKSRLQQKAGESEDEFQARRAELLAKSKTGKTTAQRQLPEGDAEFVERLKQWYQKDDAYQRIVLRISNDRIPLLMEEIWEVTQQYLGSRRRDSWLMNTASCFNFGKPCEYMKLCQSGCDKNVSDTLYQIVAPHEELPILGLNLRPAEQARYEEVRRQREHGSAKQ